MSEFTHLVLTVLMFVFNYIRNQFTFIMEKVLKQEGVTVKVAENVPIEQEAHIMTAGGF